MDRGTYIYIHKGPGGYTWSIYECASSFFQSLPYQESPTNSGKSLMYIRDTITQIPLFVNVHEASVFVNVHQDISRVCRALLVWYVAPSQILCVHIHIYT